MPLRLDFKIPDDMARKFNEAGPKVLRALQGVLTKSAIRIRDDAKLKIKEGPKTGRVYSRKGGIRHQSSAPGQAPATDHGTLISSLLFDVRYDGLGASVGSNLTASNGESIAEYLEKGTPKGQMKARPFLAPALADNNDRIVSDILKALQGVL